MDNHRVTTVQQRWQHGETGRTCESASFPGEGWYWIPPVQQREGSGLLACPFCGSSATAMRDESHWWIECDTCGAATPTENFTQHTVHADPDGLWNSRTRATVSPEVWQPIETAPKTGESILLGHGNASWEDEWFSPTLSWLQTDEGGNRQDEVPTHWMPLPAPPQVKE